MITLYMVIVENMEHGGKNSRLLQKTVHWSSVPDEGALVQIGEDGFNSYVKRVYWGDDGNVTVDLQTLIVDPDPLMQNALRQGYVASWYTKVDGERPDRMMLAAGWEER